MGINKNKKLDIIRILMAILIALIFYFVTDYLWQIFVTDGTEKFVFAAILIAATILGFAHVILFFLRKSFEKDRTEASRPLKRRLEKARNFVNYITPFILLLMLYHFWGRGWIFTTTIIAILLIDRINDLLRKNK